MLFLLISYFKLLHRCSSAFQTVTFSRTQHDAPQNLSHDHSSCVVHSLPIVSYQKDKPNGNIYDELELGRIKDTECAVCLAEFEEGDQLRYLPPCSHTFHVSCIDEWFRIHSSCPLCRSPAFNTTGGQSSELLLHNLGREDFIHYINDSNVQMNYVLHFSLLFSAIVLINGSCKSAA